MNTHIAEACDIRNSVTNGRGGYVVDAFPVRGNPGRTLVFVSRFGSGRILNRVLVAAPLSSSSVERVMDHELRRWAS